MHLVLPRVPRPKQTAIPAEQLGLSQGIRLQPQRLPADLRVRSLLDPADTHNSGLRRLLREHQERVPILNGRRGKISWLQASVHRADFLLVPDGQHQRHAEEDGQLRRPHRRETVHARHLDQENREIEQALLHSA